MQQRPVAFVPAARQLLVRLPLSMDCLWEQQVNGFFLSWNFSLLPVSVCHEYLTWSEKMAYKKQNWGWMRHVLTALSIIIFVSCPLADCCGFCTPFLHVNQLCLTICINTAVQIERDNSTFHSKKKKKIKLNLKKNSYYFLLLFLLLYFFFKFYFYFYIFH